MRPYLNSTHLPEFHPSEKQKVLREANPALRVASHESTFPE